MNTVQDRPLPDEFPTEKYPQQFIQYIVRSVAITLESISSEDVVLTEEERHRILHILSFALKCEAAWPETRTLLLRSAPIMERAGLRDDWMQYLEWGVVVSQEQRDCQTEAELCLSIGELLRLQSKFELARHCLDTSIAIFAALGENRGQARAQNELAFVAWQQHHYDEVEALTQSAIMLLDENDPERATCFSRLGLVAFDHQRWEEAERYHRTALQIRRQHGEQRRIAWSLQNLGSALRDQGRLEEAIVCYQQAVTLLEERKDFANSAIAQMNQATAHELAGQLHKALELYETAVITFGKLSDTHNLAKIFTNIGLLSLAIQDWSRGENAFMSSIRLFEQIGDTSWRLNALDGLGLIYLGQKQYEKAKVTFETALSELPKIADTQMHTYLAQVLPTQLAQTKQTARKNG